MVRALRLLTMFCRYWHFPAGKSLWHEMSKNVAPESSGMAMRADAIRRWRHCAGKLPDDRQIPIVWHRGVVRRYGRDAGRLFLTRRRGLGRPLPSIIASRLPPGVVSIRILVTLVSGTDSSIPTGPSSQPQKSATETPPALTVPARVPSGAVPAYCQTPCEWH